MTEASKLETAAPAQPEEVREAIHAHCVRAQRRLRALARESNDVLLAQALRSLRSAAALSAAPLAPPERPNLR